MNSLLKWSVTGPFYVLIAILLFIEPPQLTASSLSAKHSLSENAEISLLTCGPGSLLYNAFGHSAVRVKDPASGLDLVFNYGTFNFKEPNFYLNFLKGKLNYYLSIAPYHYFERNYKFQGRSIREQQLALSQQEKQLLYEKLRWNSEEENKYYLYDFFFDNCSTRIKDIFQNTFKNEIDYSGFQPGKSQTFRELLKPYLIKRPWVASGINLILGSPTDRRAENLEFTFLPDHLEAAIDETTIKGHPFVKKKIEILPQQAPGSGVLVGPLFFAVLLFLASIIITFLQWKKGLQSKWFDFSLFFITGFVGLIITLMWLATEHTATQWNFNCLWALPTHLIYAFFCLRKASPAQGYRLISVVFILLMLFNFGLIPQSFEPTFYLLAATLLLRLIAPFLPNYASARK